MVKRKKIMSTEFKIEGEYIELIQLLKATGIASTGGHAKFIVDDGAIVRNGEVETRKRAKLIPGDVIEIDGQKIELK
jgi:ribosome-associated protein